MAERLFTVIVPVPGKPALAYPDLTGEKAVETMETMKSRGYEPVARTTANGITEDLTLDHMLMIFDGSWE